MGLFRQQSSTQFMCCEWRFISRTDDTIDKCAALAVPRGPPTTPVDHHPRRNASTAWSVVTSGAVIAGGLASTCSTLLGDAAMTSLYDVDVPARWLTHRMKLNVCIETTEHPPLSIAQRAAHAREAARRVCISNVSMTSWRQRRCCYVWTTSHASVPARQEIVSCQGGRPGVPCPLPCERPTDRVADHSIVHNLHITRTELNWTVIHGEELRCKRSHAFRTKRPRSLQCL